MSLNFLGLGFNFGSKDSGLGKHVKKLTKGFGGFEQSFDKAATSAIDRSPKIAEGVGLIERAVGKLDQILTQNKLQTWLASFSLSKLGDISDGIKEIASGINLTTGLEATMTTNLKATKALGANFGYVGKEAQKFAGSAASMAYSLNIGTEVAGSATYAMDTWGKALKAVGIDSKATAAKVQEVFGLDVNKFGNQLTTLQKEFGFTDKQLSNVVGGMQAFGQQNGDVKGSLEKLPDLIESVRKQATSLGKTLDAESLAEYATQTTELAAGFYAVTADTEGAQKQAMAVSNALIEANVNLGKMFAGTEGDLGKFAQGLGIASGDIDKAFKLMKKGPSGFVKGLGGMIADMGGFSKMTGEQANFIQKQLMEAMGPEAGQMVFEFFQKADTSTLKAMSVVKEATSSIGKMGKEAFSTGLTLQESFDRAKDAFVMNFRAIAHKEAVAFVKDTTTEFGKFSKRLKEIADEGGPLGAITKKFAEMHQIGALALLPKTLRPMAAVFGSMLQEATPLIGALGSLGLRFTHLTNPLTLAVVGFGALAWSMKAAENNALKSSKSLNGAKKTLAGLEQQNSRLHKQGKASLQLDQQIAKQKDAVNVIEKQVLADARAKNKQQIGSMAKSILQRVGTFFAALPEIFKSVWKTVKDMWPEIGPPILSALQSAFSWLKDKVWPAVRDFAKGVWQGIVYGSEVEGGSSAMNIGATIGAALRAGLTYAIDLVKNYFKKWWSNMVGIWSDSSMSFTDKIKATMSDSAGLIIGAFALAKFTPVFSILGTLGSLLGSLGGLVPAISSVLAALGGLFGAGAAVGAAVLGIGALIAGFLFFPEATKKAVGAIGDFLRKVLPWITEKALDIGEILIKYVVLGPIMAIAALGPRIINAIADALKGIVGIVVQAVIGILDGIESWLSKKLPAAAGVIHVVFEGVRLAVRAVGAVISWLIDLVAGAIKVIGWIFGKIAGAIGAVIGVIGDVVSAVGSAVSAVGGFLSDVGSGVKDFFTSNGVIDEVMNKIKESSDRAGPSVSDMVARFAASANKLAGVRTEAVKTFATINELIADTVAKGNQLSAKTTAEEAAKQAALITGQTIASEQQRLGALAVIQKDFANQSAAIMATVPEAMKSEAAKASGELNRAYFEQLRSITMNEQMSVTDRKAALASLELWKITKLNEYGQLVNQQQKLVTAGGDAAVASMTDTFGKFTDVLTVKSNEAALKAGGAIGSVQKELGVSADAALTSITSLSAIDPKRFASNLAKIKETFIKFSKEIATAFQSAWDSALRATTAAMVVIDATLTGALMKMRGLASMMDVKFEMDRQARQAARPAGQGPKDIRTLGENERDQELLNATNWPLWYDDYRVQFSALVASMSSLASGTAKGGRTTAPSNASGGGATGLTRGAR